MTDSDNPALDALIARGASLKRVFDELPIASAATIANEAVERIALTPEGEKWEEAGIVETETLVTMVLTAVGLVPPFSALGVRALDLALRGALVLYKMHAAADLASKRAAGDPSTPATPAG